MRILLIDDSRAALMLAAHIIEDTEFDVFPMQSWAEAQAWLATNGLPDLAVLDLHMPDVSGFDIAAYLKYEAADHYLPILFLTGTPNEQELLKCLEYGDDVILKPINHEMLKAKVRSHARLFQQYKLLESKRDELLYYQRKTASEHEMVESLFMDLYRNHLVEADNLKLHVSPQSLFFGDVLITAVSPSGNLYLLVGDMTGHGLPAAVGTIPIYETFNTMVMKGCTVGTIAAEINKTLRRFLPDHMLFAATIIEFDAGAETATIWCGGMPQGFIARQGRIVDVIDSDHMPLAALDPYEFSQDVKLIKLYEGDKIYVFTDGVEESRNERDEMFGETRLYELFDGSTDQVFNRIIDELMIFTLSTEQEDDITLVEYSVDKNAYFALPESPQETEERLRAIPWTLEFKLSPEEMRKSDPVIQIVTLLKNAIGLNIHQDFISTVLSELYSNALEHGLLGLSSDLKDTELGFSDYYLQRRDKLELLTIGEIIIQLDFHPHDENGYVNISITDSGIGFDVEKVKAEKALKAQKSHDDDDAFGRGINILDELCTDVSYSNGGRTVTAIYPLRNMAIAPIDNFSDDELSDILPLPP